MRRTIGCILLGLVGCGFQPTLQGADGGDAPSADSIDASTFVVASVPSLVLWLRADIGVTTNGAATSAWADQSGNNNNATESRIGFQPALVASAIGQLPTIHFSSNDGDANGTDLLLPLSASLTWGEGDFLVELVARYDNTPADPTASAQEDKDGYGALFVTIFGVPIGLAAAGFGLYANAPPVGANPASTSVMAYAVGGFAATSAGSGYNNQLPHCFAIQRAGTTLSVRVDGAIVGSQQIPAGTNGGGGGHFGGIENATTQRLDGDISEVIAINGSIASTDLSGIEHYLRAKYDLP